jgi:hypothetical protein
MNEPKLDRSWLAIHWDRKAGSGVRCLAMSRRGPGCEEPGSLACVRVELMALTIPTKMFQLTGYRVKYADAPGDPKVEPARSAEQAVRFYVRNVGAEYGRTVHVWSPKMHEAQSQPYRYDLRGRVWAR